MNATTITQSASVAAPFVMVDELIMVAGQVRRVVHTQRDGDLVWLTTLTALDTAPVAFPVGRSAFVQIVGRVLKAA